MKHLAWLAAWLLLSHFSTGQDHEAVERVNYGRVDAHALYRSLVRAHTDAVAIELDYQLDVETQTQGPTDESFGKRTPFSQGQAHFRLARAHTGSGEVKTKRARGQTTQARFFGDGFDWFSSDSDRKLYQRSPSLAGAKFTPRVSVFSYWTGREQKPLQVIEGPTPAEEGFRRIIAKFHQGQETYLVNPAGGIVAIETVFERLRAGGLVRTHSNYVIERWETRTEIEEEELLSWRSHPPVDHEEVEANWAQTQELVAPGQMLDDLRLVFLGGYAENLSTLRGKTVVLSFWFVDCLPCRRELPELDKLAREYTEEDDVVFLCLNSSDKRDRLESFWFDQDFEALKPVMVTSKATASCRVRSFPSLYVIDPQGRVTLRSIGFTPGASIRKLQRHLPEPRPDLDSESNIKK